MHAFDLILDGVERHMSAEVKKLLRALHDVFFIKDDGDVRNVAHYIEETMKIAYAVAIDMLIGSSSGERANQKWQKYVMEWVPPAEILAPLIMHLKEKWLEYEKERVNVHKLPPFLKNSRRDVDGHLVFKGFDILMDELHKHALKGCYSDPVVRADVKRMHWTKRALKSESGQKTTIEQRGVCRATSKNENGNRGINATFKTITNLGPTCFESKLKSTMALHNHSIKHKYNLHEKELNKLSASELETDVLRGVVSTDVRWWREDDINQLGDGILDSKSYPDVEVPQTPPSYVQVPVYGFGHQNKHNTERARTQLKENLERLTGIARSFPQVNASQGAVQGSGSSGGGSSGGSGGGSSGSMGGSSSESRAPALQRPRSSESEAYYAGFDPDPTMVFRPGQLLSRESCMSCPCTNACSVVGSYCM